MRSLFLYLEIDDMSTLKTLLRASALTLGLVLAATAGAGVDSREARKLLEAGDIVPLERITEDARTRHPGRILEVELDREDGRYVYEVELVDERGVVWELYYDARTGELLKDKRED